MSPGFVAERAVLGQQGSGVDRVASGRPDLRVADPMRPALRGPGENYSDVIILLAAVGRDPLNGS